MKKQPVNPHFPILKHAILFLLLVGAIITKACPPGEATRAVGVFINDKQLHLEMDSLAIGAKGTLTLHALVNESPKAERVKFMVLIRRNFAGNALLFPWDEKFNNGEAISAFEVNKIRNKVKPGDLLVLIPIVSESGAANWSNQLVITLKWDNC